ncbi:hypothetical protein [Hymenobacter terricola]|uniref:hypothetical protein n=1 Tax=Hymenobacter terricola TaxID=2819236 RepID=UPI001B305E1D|nr:hypothetical protein [Hymenobacter terricola]
MKSHPQPPVAVVPAVGSPSAPPTKGHRFDLSAIKARAKAIKKLRKQEDRRYFISWCSCIHALGFSF